MRDADFPGPGLYRMYWTYTANRQRDYVEKNFSTKDECEAEITKYENKGYIITKVCLQVRK